MQKNSSANKVNVSVVPIRDRKRAKDLRQKVTISINVPQRLDPTQNMLLPRRSVTQLTLPFARGGQLSLPFEEAIYGNGQD
jgi:hypothetical protein